MQHDYIPISVDDMPYSQEIELLETSFIFKFYYNEVDDKFYVDLYDYDGNLIRSGEPLVLNQPLWRNISDDTLPAETIVPIDESGLATEITADNLGITVQLCIDDLGDDENGN